MPGYDADKRLRRMIKFTGKNGSTSITGSRSI